VVIVVVHAVVHRHITVIANVVAVCVYASAHTRSTDVAYMVNDIVYWAGRDLFFTQITQMVAVSVIAFCHSGCTHVAEVVFVVIIAILSVAGVKHQDKESDRYQVTEQLFNSHIKILFLK
jgi:hypothetical protein